MSLSAGEHVDSKVQSVSRTPARVDGWKEIAVYLGRGERTVKRWEADRGLPVHRLPGGGRASVFALLHELDEWIHSNNVSDFETADDAQNPGSSVSGQRDEVLASDTASANVSLACEALDAGPETQVHRLWWRNPWLLVAAAAFLAGTATLAASRGVFSVRHRHPPESTSISGADKTLAHDLYLKGRFEWNKRTPESLERALDDFTEAIVHDPASAPAYSGLADTYVLMHEYSSLRERDAYPRAIAAAQKAVELNDSLAEAHRSLAFAEVWGTWNFADSDKQFRRAIELDPQDPLTHLWFATAFEGMPSWRAVALREFNRAQELDPSSPVVLSNKGIWLFEVGERKAGFDLVRQVEQDNPDFVAPHRYLAMMYWILRKYPDFLAENEKVALLKHDDILMEVTHAALSGYRRNGERGLLASIYLARKKYDLKSDEKGPSLAEICLRLGRRDEAVQLLQGEFDQRRALVGFYLIPDLDVLKEDPRYREMLAKIDLSAPVPPLP